MLNSNSEETPPAVGSSVTEDSKISKLTGKFFNFHLKSVKDNQPRNEENLESEKIRSEIKGEMSTKHSDFFKNIKKKLQIRKFMPSKSRQKIKVADSSNEGFNRSLSERAVNIQEQVKGPNNPVNSYIEAVTCNGQNGALSERVPRVSQTGETSFPNSETNARNLPKQETNTKECDNLNKDDSEGKNGTKVTLTDELVKLSKYGWYWGPISRDEADSKLLSEPDGAFLVRDSSDHRYLLTLSFKSSGKIRHSRMEYTNGLFSLCNHSENQGYASVIDLINHSMSCSQSAIICYSRSRNPAQPSFPVRLTKPVSRFTQVRSLQYLCRFVIRQNTRLDNIHKLPLPKPIKGYIEEAYY